MSATFGLVRQHVRQHIRPRASRRRLVARLAALAELDLDFLAVVNPGCQRQQAGSAGR